ncbi:ligninase h2 precursor [Diplodia corticola]|uniref:Peroxidase n=1 Tax=Diplodia corticola TaxID=236234 RepID=A0A1J9QJ90_9PEZI|nr:ligninase h2 precursor [Diplodia corticola]OJD28926.1 ligninase h2 precursor [Diplodia corticola]
MKFSAVFSSIALTVLIQPTVAHPGMANLVSEIRARQDANTAVVVDLNADGDADPQMIGDLATVGPTTPVGNSIYNILTGAESGETQVSGYTPPLFGTKACKADTCCVWSYVSAELSLTFLGPTGRCNKWARAAIRLGFHDAGTWSNTTWGGADGSIALSGTEINRSENNGLQDIIGKMITIQKRWGVGMADLIQFAGVHAVVTCPLGPRIRFFAGRQDSKTAGPEGLLPGVNDSADKLIQLFQNKTISPHELAALVGAHTASQQFTVNTTLAGAPQDSTPGVWDTRFYNQTTSNQVPKKVFRFASDVVLANDSRVQDEWVQFTDPVTGQKHWNEDYAAAYTRLSLLGVNNINSLTECSKVLPAQRIQFPGASTLWIEQ